MKRIKGGILVMLFSSLLFYACTTTLVPVEESSEDTEATVQQMFSDAQTETAVFQTAVSKEITKQAPPPSATFTVTPAPTDTPEWKTLGDMFHETKTAEAKQPISDNPWVLQPWCEDHVGCEKMEVKNKSSYWVNVFLEFRDTGVNKYFSVAPKSVGWITMRPGYYRYIFTFCGGAKVNEGYHGLNSHWYLLFKDNDCK